MGVSHIFNNEASYFVFVTTAKKDKRYDNVSDIDKVEEEELMRNESEVTVSEAKDDSDNDYFCVRPCLQVEKDN